MQKVLVAHPRLGLAADLALLAILPLLGDEVALALGRVGAEVLGDEAALGNDERLAAGGRDGDDGRLAERVDGLELGRREAGLLVAVEDFDLVGDAELLEEPDDALGAGLLEPAMGGRGMTVSCCCGLRVM